MFKQELNYGYGDKINENAGENKLRSQIVIPPSYFSNNTFELRLLIDTNWTVVVNANMEALRARYNAYFYLLDRGTPECVLSIHCPLESIEQCVADLLRKMNSVKTSEQRYWQDVRMLIQRAHAKALVANGKRELIDLIMIKRTQCGIRVASKCCPGSTEHVCLITGPNTAKFPSAVKLLVEFMAPIAPIFPHNQYDPKNYSRDGAYGGFYCSKPMIALGERKVLLSTVSPVLRPVQAVQQQQQFQPPPPSPWVQQQPPPPSLLLSDATAAIGNIWPAVPPPQPSTPATTIPMDCSCGDESWRTRTTAVDGEEQQQSFQRQVLQQIPDNNGNVTPQLFQSDDLTLMRRQLNAMRVAQTRLVNEQSQMDRLLVEERAKVQKAAAERQMMEHTNRELVEETVALAKQCGQLKLTNAQLRVEMDSLKRSRQNVVENGGEDVKCNKMLLLAEQLRKVQVERDGLVEHRLDREARMLALIKQLQAKSEQCEELKQDLDWMMVNKDELVEMEVEKFKGSKMFLHVDDDDGITTGNKTVPATGSDVDQLRIEMEKLKQTLRSAEKRAELKEQTARAEFEQQEDRLRALKLELREAHRAKKSERTKRKALEEEVEKQRQKLMDQQQSRQKKTASGTHTKPVEAAATAILTVSSQQQKRAVINNMLDI